MKAFAWLLIIVLGGTVYFLWRRLESSLKDKTELEESLVSMQQEKKIVFDFLHDLGEAFSEKIDRGQLLNIILRCAMKVSEARGGAIYLWDASKQWLKAEVVAGVFPPPFQVEDSVADKIVSRQEYLENFLKTEIIKPASESVVMKVAQSGRPLAVANAGSDPRFPKFSEEALQVSSYLAIPLHYRDEKIGLMALANREDGGQFSTADFEVVKSVADQASYSLHSAKIYSQLSDKKKMDHDLQVAREIQRILLPAVAPTVPGYEFCALNLPAQQVSGDYYDFIAVDEHRWGLAIADVSGKGIPASLIMAMCRSVLRSEAAGNPSPSQVLREVNRQLYPDIREDMFITMIYLILDDRTHELRIARAGHEAPLFCSHDFETVEVISTPGMALGIDGGSVFDEVIKDATLSLKPHDTVVVYTDGINEALDEQGEEFGREHLKTALTTAGKQGVDFLVKNIVERVQRFSSGQPQNDDITLAALQRKAS